MKLERQRENPLPHGDTGQDAVDDDRLSALLPIIAADETVDVVFGDMRYIDILLDRRLFDLYLPHRSFMGSASTSQTATHGESAAQAQLPS